MRAISYIFILLLTSSGLYAAEFLDFMDTELASGFRERNTTESNGKFRYLYFGDKKLGQLGNYSISPSGYYAAFQDSPAGNIYLFRTAENVLVQLTSEFIAPVEKYSWNETLEVLRVEFTGQAEAQSFALE